MKILVIRFSSIGDIVLTSPVVRCLKMQLPDAEIHFATKKSYSALLSNSPYIDKVHSLEDSLPALISALKQENFDYVIDLHHNLRTLRVKRAMGVKSFSFDKLNLEKWLMVNFKYNRLPDVHIVARYMQTVNDLGITYDGAGMNFFIDHSKVDTQVTSSLPGSFFSFAIGGQHFTKRLPSEKIALLCEKLAPHPIVLLGDDKDAVTATPIAEKYPHLINLCGKINLFTSAQVVLQSKALITHDTGLMHIGAALDKPIASIWGNTIPGFGMYPFYADHAANRNRSGIFEVNDLSCRPCSKIGYDHCPKKHFRCMRDQDTDAIAGFLRSL